MKRGRKILIAGGIVAVAVLPTGAIQLRDWQMRRALVIEYPERVTANASLAAFGTALGEEAYGAHCGSCHGAALEGNQAIGAPNLKDDIWLHEDGDVADIERTILYGVRAGHAKGRVATPMPGLGVQKTLVPEEIDDVTAYTLSLSGGPSGDPAAIARGQEIFRGKGGCYDCHGEDGAGDRNFGASNLTDTEWTFGGDPQSVRRSIYDGRRARCPAFIGVLDFATIRGLAVYLYRMSHPEA
jgi:cytochrome c oxidase cbb3-type subunit 3